MTKRASGERKPREDEEQYVASVQSSLKEFWGTLSDEDMETTFGPGALREVHMCWLPRVGWVHLACVKSRAGDVLLLLHITLARKKGSGLPLYVAAKLEPQPGQHLLQRVTTTEVLAEKCTNIADRRQVAEVH